MLHDLPDADLFHGHHELVVVNIGWSLFNLLPIPPLDGSRVVDGLVPYRWRKYWEGSTRYASIALLGAGATSERPAVSG